MKYFVLSRNTKILADESCAPIRNAVEILKRDMAAGLRGEGPENRIRVELEAGMAAESYRAEITPEEILLKCGDDLGAVYALLSVSRRLLEVKPLDWWMDMAPKSFDTVCAACGGWASPTYRVRYRSWFINDEVLFTGWHMEESLRYEVWKRAFEAILRCGGNMVIPGPGI